MPPRLVVVSQMVHAGISTFAFLPLPPPETARRQPGHQTTTRTRSHECDSASDQERDGQRPTDDRTLVLTQKRLHLVQPARVRIRIHIVPARKLARTRRVVRVIAVLRETLRAHARARWYWHEIEPSPVERGALQTWSPVGIGRGGVGFEAAEGVLESLVDEYGDRERAVGELQVSGAKCRLAT